VLKGEEASATILSGGQDFAQKKGRGAQAAYPRLLFLRVRREGEDRHARKTLEERIESIAATAFDSEKSYSLIFSKRAGKDWVFEKKHDRLLTFLHRGGRI